MVVSCQKNLLVVSAFLAVLVIFSIQSANAAELKRLSDDELDLIMAGNNTGHKTEVPAEESKEPSLSEAFLSMMEEGGSEQMPVSLDISNISEISDSAVVSQSNVAFIFAAEDSTLSQSNIAHIIR